MAEETGSAPSSEDPVGPGREAEETTGGGSEGQDQEELRQRLEEQLRRIRVQDLLLESAASVLNLAARRIGNPEERDLEQGRIGIEAVRAIVELLEPGPREQVREALSQVQVLYAREAKGGPEEGGGEGGGEPPTQDEPPQAPPQRPSGLWTPGRD
jgi:hypothetical protein